MDQVGHMEGPLAAADVAWGDPWAVAAWPLAADGEGVDGGAHGGDGEGVVTALAVEAWEFGRTWQWAA